MSTLRLRTEIAAPAETCHRLALTVPLQQQALQRVHAVAVAGVTDRPLAEGETVTWSARWLGIRWRLTTRIVSSDPPREFVDEQVSGPFGHWHHRHRFEPVGAGTVMEDVVDWAAPGGPVGRLAEQAGLARFVCTLLTDHNLRLAGLIGASAR